ncbi:TatD-related deoxyribonuclease [Vulcanisaeta moutnovskia 768-28]|uniref:TatD-related deoxyribonuclease n=1 Tax=Vulcanisaeta moutnovskia (strain 768-28) TaxID=985053 RepID=F0QTZ1_VULM7|nr:TatD family hydrolase [Vulcanisaeta moutnovskia]ADY01777.1 TatD-related deoxyribonuclease [Vulcanisaeta moutnovskia 768-28]
MRNKDLPLCDNHAHTNPVIGMGPRELARRFRREGGKFIVIVALLTWSLGLTPGDLDSVRRMYDITVESTRIINEEGVKSVAIVGLHPAEGYELLRRGWSREDVRKFMEKGIDLAAEYVREGKAVGIGEIGRPHWEAPNDVVNFFNELIEYAFRVAKDVNAVLHLHLERNGVRTALSITDMMRRVGNRPYSVVMHHAEPVTIDTAYNSNVMPSIPMGRRGEFEDAVKHGPSFVVESDFIDDPKRPGAVIPPWTLVKKLRGYVVNGIINDDFLYRICVDNIGRVYGITYS